MLVPEPVNDAAGGEIEQSLAVLAKVIVGIGAAIQGLDVLRVEANGGGSVLDNLFPFAERVVTGSPVGVVDWIRLAKNRFGVQANRLLIVLRPVGLVPRLLQLLGVFLALGI